MIVGRGLYLLNPFLPRTNDGVGTRGSARLALTLVVKSSEVKVGTVDRSIVNEGRLVTSTAWASAPARVFVLETVSSSRPSLLPPDSPSEENKRDSLFPLLFNLLINLDPFLPLVFHHPSNLSVPLVLEGLAVMYFLETGFPIKSSLHNILRG